MFKTGGFHVSMGKLSNDKTTTSKDLELKTKLWKWTEAALAQYLQGTSLLHARCDVTACISSSVKQSISAMTVTRVKKINGQWYPRKTSRKLVPGEERVQILSNSYNVPALPDRGLHPCYHNNQHVQVVLAFHMDDSLGVVCVYVTFVPPD
jgi:hypothetical protein